MNVKITKTDNYSVYLQVWYSSFEDFDENCNGYITSGELMLAMQDIGHKPTKGEVKKMIATYDISGRL